VLREIASPARLGSGGLIFALSLALFFHRGEQRAAHAIRLEPRGAEALGQVARERALAARHETGDDDERGG